MDAIVANVFLSINTIKFCSTRKKSGQVSYFDLLGICNVSCYFDSQSKEISSTLVREPKVSSILQEFFRNASAHSSEYMGLPPKGLGDKAKAFSLSLTKYCTNV